MNNNLTKGLIIKLTGGNYYVKIIDDIIIKCRARGLFRYQDIKPVVGDFVMIELLDYDEGYIIEVLSRKNHMIRPAIANIDQALIVTSYKEPNYAFNLINKFLAIIEFYNIKPIIIVTKCDLEIDHSSIVESFKDYWSYGYDVYYTSINDLESINNVKVVFDNKLSILVGQSGSGKSSLLNLLDDSFAIKTNQISKALNRGKHTTRHVEIYDTKFGAIADSPGFSSLNLDMLDVDNLSKSYHDFRDASQYCKFSNCLHQHEPNCQVKELVQNNNIPESRYLDYLIFLEEIKQRKVRY